MKRIKYFILIAILFLNIAYCEVQTYLASDIFSEAIVKNKKIIIVNTINLSEVDYNDIFSNIPEEKLELLFLKSKITQILYPNNVNSQLIKIGKIVHIGLKTDDNSIVITSNPEKEVFDEKSEWSILSLPTSEAQTNFLVILDEVDLFKKTKEVLLIEPYGKYGVFELLKKVDSKLEDASLTPNELSDLKITISFYSKNEINKLSEKKIKTEFGKQLLKKVILKSK